MSSLDDFLDSVLTQDVKGRLGVYKPLVAFLSDPSAVLKSDSLDKFVDGLDGWVSCSNYKVSLDGLEVLCLLVDRMGEGFKPYIAAVLLSAIDRLGDSKEQVRDQAQELLLKMMMPASSPQYVFDHMAGAFTHKLWHVREGVLVCLQNTINRCGARSLSLSKIVPAVCKLIDDQNGQVREAAVVTLTEIYRHVGEKVRSDLNRKAVSAQRLIQIFARFDEVKRSGNMLPTADIPMARSCVDDDIDFATPYCTKVPKAKKASSVTGVPAYSKHKAQASARTTSSVSTTVMGAVDKELFIKAFADTQDVKLFSCRDFTDSIAKVNAILSDSNQDWEKRVEQYKMLRSLVKNGASDMDDFGCQLKMLEPCLTLGVKDLRSQVVREACITIAYLAQHVGHRMEHCAECVLPALFNLIPNSAKIMSSSGCVCIRFITQYVHTSRLVPIVTGNTASKSSLMRRQAFDFLDLLLHSWTTHTLEKHTALIQDSITRGINDADAEARVFARRAFWGFSKHFQSQANALFNSLEASKQRTLQGERDHSSAGDAQQIPAAAAHVGKRPVRPASQDRWERRDYAGYSGTLPSKSSASGIAASWNNSHSGAISPVSSAKSSVYMVRSCSDLDLSHVKAKVNSHWTKSEGVLGTRGMVNGSTASLPRPKTSRPAAARPGVNTVTPKQLGRSHTQRAVTQSQPGSRSASPSSSRMVHGRGLSKDYATPVRANSRPAVPHCQRESRESSPSGRTLGRERRLSGSQGQDLLSQRVLWHGADVEHALQDALSKQTRKRYDTYDSDDAASETSSVCSERSSASHVGRTSEDIREIIALLLSSSHIDRRDGLLSLQNVLQSGRYLSRMELKKVTEVFTRMFHDPHNKVFSVFLDALAEICHAHSRDLIDWLYVLLTRLFNKSGADILGSVHAKVIRTLDTVRDTFPCDSLFSTIAKFIADQTQSLSMKVKISMLNFLQSVISVMDPSDYSNTMDTRLAVSRIINWTMEPRNVDVRKICQMVLVALFNLNPPEFSLVLSALPKSFQDGATRILQNHIRSADQASSDILSPRDLSSLPSVSQQRGRTLSRQSHHQSEDVETENMNPQDIFDSIKQTSADIQLLSLGSKLGTAGDDIKKREDFAFQDSGNQEIRNDSPDGPYSRRNVQQSSQAALSRPEFAQQNGVAVFNRGCLRQAANHDKQITIPDILRELSNHNERTRERRSMLSVLERLVKDGTISTTQWDEHFKSILLMLIETFGDSDKLMRYEALTVFRSILKRQSARFQYYAELTILKICEAHTDPSRDVQRAAGECSMVIPKSISPEQALPILNQIIRTSSFPVLWAAVKMQTDVVKLMPVELLKECLPDTVPGLLTAYENTDSKVRKAVVFCLVNVHSQVGEELRPHLAELSSSKTKLLNLYIKRSEERARSELTSPASSDP